MTPILITVEGPDGCGKSTVVPLLTAALIEETGEAWSSIADPTPGPTTQIIRGILSSGIGVRALFYLFMAERILDFPDEIEAPFLVSDRGLLSTWAYQHELCKDPARREIVKLALSQESLLRRPAATVILLPPVEVCVERAAARRGRLEIFDGAAVIRRIWGLYRCAGFALGMSPSVTGRVLTIEIQGTEPPKYVVNSVLEGLRRSEVLSSPPQNSIGS